MHCDCSAGQPGKRERTGLLGTQTSGAIASLDGKEKKLAPVIERDPLATDMPARQRFRAAAGEALKIVSDRTLNILAYRMEMLNFAARLGAQSIDELPAGDRKSVQRVARSLTRKTKNESVPMNRAKAPKR